MQRWSLFIGDGRHSTGMAGDPDGAFVEFSDYDTLRAQLEAAEADCARLRVDAERWRFVAADHSTAWADDIDEQIARTKEETK